MYEYLKSNGAILGVAKNEYKFREQKTLNDDFFRFFI